MSPQTHLPNSRTDDKPLLTCHACKRLAELLKLVKAAA